MAKKKTGLTFLALMARKSWQQLPPIVVLTGQADFLKRLLQERLTKELFGEADPDIRRLEAPRSGGDELGLAQVLDELRTPSFFSTQRIVAISPADGFVSTHGGDLVPHLEGGFSGGHLVLDMAGKIDQRTRFAKQAKDKGWVVECPQPYDRPPPWDTRTPVWDSELSHWIVAHARKRGLELTPKMAFLLHQRAGTDLAILDEELEKLGTYLTARGTHTVDEEAIRAIVGDLKENSIFMLLDLILETRRAESIENVDRLFTRGNAPARGPTSHEPTSIALQLLGALIPRLRALRRAHAMRAHGSARSPDDWVRAGLVLRPFVSRFQRQLETTPPQKISRMLEHLYNLDRSIKRGGDAARLVELFVVEFA